MNKNLKRIVSVLLTLAMLASMASVVFAAKTAASVPEIGTANVPESAKNTVKSIIGFVKWIGYAVAVGMLLYIGIKYVMASANEKADLKAGAIKYVIGAVLVAASVSVVDLIASAGDGTSATRQ